MAVTSAKCAISLYTLVRFADGADLVVRGDGTLVEIESHLTPAREFKELAKLIKDWRVAVFFIPSFASNYFYAYQGALLPYLFNARTRALIALLTGLGSIVGSIFVGMLLDKTPFKRRSRALVGLGATTLLILVVWLGGLGFQVQFTRTTPHTLWDWTDAAAVGPIILFMAYYIGDAAFQGMSSCRIDASLIDVVRSCVLRYRVPQQRPLQTCPTGRILQGVRSPKLALETKLTSSVQSAGSAISFGMDAVEVS